MRQRVIIYFRPLPGEEAAVQATLNTIVGSRRRFTTPGEPTAGDAEVRSGKSGTLVVLDNRFETSGDAIAVYGQCVAALAIGGSLHDKLQPGSMISHHACPHEDDPVQGYNCRMHPSYQESRL